MNSAYELRKRFYQVMEESDIEVFCRHQDTEFIEIKQYDKHGEVCQCSSILLPPRKKEEKEMNEKIYIILNEFKDYKDAKLTLREAIALIKQLPGKSSLYKQVDYNSEMQLAEMEKQKESLPNIGGIMNEDK